MKHLYLNLKRFDIPCQFGGVNSIAPYGDWGPFIVESTEPELLKHKASAEFVMFFPEAHILGAVKAKKDPASISIGCQGVFKEDTKIGGNFGAFTTSRTANSMKAAGVGAVIIGHCEERRKKEGILKYADKFNKNVINQMLNDEIGAAQAAGLKVLYCVGETEEEQPDWQNVLGAQLETGLKGTDLSGIVIGYEPVWSIGPGKTPADKDYITKIARFIKEKTGGTDVIYGGGLKADNAKMLASIPEIDGGLIALTRFTGDIGFYPEEYLEIIRLYLG